MSYDRNPDEVVHRQVDYQVLFNKLVNAIPPESEAATDELRIVVSGNLNLMAVWEGVQQPLARPGFDSRRDL